MFDNLFLYFFLASISFTVISALFFSLQKKNIIKNYKQTDSKEYKNIYGTIVTKSGMLRQRFEWCTFDILVNKNSVFLFTKNFYFVPSRFINLVYSTSNNKYLKYTRRPKQVREFNIKNNNVEIVFMRDSFMFETSKIYLKNLTQEQIMILESVLNKKIND